jgi:hypothetical protein
MTLSAYCAASNSVMAGPLSLDGWWSFHSRQGALAACCEEPAHG